MNQIAIAWVSFGGTALVVIGGLIGAWWKTRAANTAADAAEMDAETRQLQALWKRLEELEEKVAALEEQARIDRAVRHRLKGALAYVLSVAQQGISIIMESWSDAQIAGLPEPLRAHVRGDMDFSEHRDLTRARD